MSYSDRRALRYTPWGWIVGTIVVVLIVFALAIPMCSSYTKHRDVIALVESKERVCDGGKDCKYLVFTDAGTFRVTDSLIIGRFNSSDVYGRIKECHEYKFEVYGWRFGLTSSYPNIADFEDRGRIQDCEED